MASKPFYSISEAAREVRRHPDTLRAWEREGLIRPTRVNSGRIYTATDIEVLRRIARSKERR